MSGSYAFAMYTTSVEKLALGSHVVMVDEYGEAQNARLRSGVRAGAAGRAAAAAARGHRHDQHKRREQRHSPDNMTRR